MTAILLLAALLQSPDFDLNGNGDVPYFTLNGGDVPAMLRPAKAEPTRGPLFLAYSSPGCALCPVAKKQTERLQLPRIKWKDEAPAELGIKYYPAFHWETPDGKGKISQGWYGLDPLLKLYDESMGEPRGKALRKVMQQARTGYPIRGNWWTGCGSWHHLATGEHAGKFDHRWLASLSNAEIQSLHSDDHEGRVHWEYVVRPMASTQATIQYQVEQQPRRGLFGIFRGR